MNILDMLKEEHRAIEQLMTLLSHSSSRETDARREGLATCEHALLVQMEVEEGVLYPTLRLRMTESEAECTLDAYAQNYAVADLLSRLMLLAPDDEIWRASLRVVKDNLERHHAEEEATIFMKAREKIDEPTLAAMGRRYAALREQRSLERLEKQHRPTFASVSPRHITAPLQRQPYAVTSA